MNKKYVTRISSGDTTQELIIYGPHSITISLNKTQLKAIEAILGYYIDAEGNLYGYSDTKIRKLTQLVNSNTDKSLP